MASPSGARASAFSSVAAAGAAVGSSAASCAAAPASGRAMTSLAILVAAAAFIQMASACKNCVVLGKAEKAMFRAHSEACLAQSLVAPAQVEALLGGELLDAPALRRHVYCVLLKCKVVGKDGKLLKSALRGKLAARPGGANITKVLENCADQANDLTPEDVAWNMFRCGYDKKAVLFDYMPTDKLQADVL